jgi:hypothetical protein
MHMTVSEKTSHSLSASAGAVHTQVSGDIDTHLTGLSISVNLDLCQSMGLSKDFFSFDV